MSYQKKKNQAIVRIMNREYDIEFFFNYKFSGAKRGRKLRVIVDLKFKSVTRDSIFPYCTAHKKLFFL